jgi:hypothetical protein
MKSRLAAKYVLFIAGDFQQISVGKFSVQNRLSSRLLSKNIKIRIYETIILLYGCAT